MVIYTTKFFPMPDYFVLLLLLPNRIKLLQTIKKIRKNSYLLDICIIIIRKV